MTNEELLTQFESFIDGESLDTDFEVQLAEMAKSELELELKLEITKKLDTSQTSTVGGTYTTPYILPSDILVPLMYIYVGTTRRTAIPLEQRELYKDDSSKFYIDLRQGKFYLCGTVNAAETITFPYIYKTTAITNSTSTVVVWPDTFHSLIPMKMAQMYFAIDQGDKARAWDDRWANFYTMLKNKLIDWDASYKLSAIGGVTPYGDDGALPSASRINGLP